MRDAAPALNPAATSSDVAAIDALVAAFYALFDNRDAPSPLLDAPHRVFLPGATVTRRDGDTASTLTLDAFLAPRRAWLADGTLTGFHEWETAERTHVAGGIATRRSRYRKRGRRDGVAIDGAGVKSLHLVRTGDGWRIAAVLWEDGDDLDWPTTP
ncbi:DUF4440 domain-containing protein [Cognatilysobacter segetis]|uniref:DUF4440 domain-containing protein n=1 Tax=Cognatilysobacter segetis TaxID=2492394 RepID=UPI001061E173|nr:DUF4440 domain-containing protein [Lysobacter segetis]